jgi:rfaE bifunctional protein nucleotidyltransferase chain/domain
MENKIKTQKECAEIAAEAKREGKVVVTTNGSFDILHYAHANLLQKAKKEGDILIVLLNSDDSIKRYKGDLRPIISQKERALMLAALQSVDYVVIFEEDDPLALLKKIKPHIHVKGGSFVLERIQQEQETLKEWQGAFKNFELEDGFSTTNIINTILEKHEKINIT